MSKGNPFLAVRLSPETMDRLRSTSLRLGRRVASLAREALATGLATDLATASAAASVKQDAHRVAPRPHPRRPSRIQRASAAIGMLRELVTEYEDWRARLPEFVEESATAEKLEAAIETLETALGALEDLDLPRGYGRD